MIIRIIFICLFVTFTSACDYFRPDRCGNFIDDKKDDGQASSTIFTPTSVYCGDVQNITQSQSDDDSDSATSEDNEVEEVEEVDELEATVIASRINSEGETIYKIGPGSSITRVSGSANTVWCKFGSNCNGDNRTEVNVTSPPSTWISYKHAEFRRSGSAGNDVRLNVDGQMIRHSF